jgi:hypothetical protein
MNWYSGLICLFFVFQALQIDAQEAFRLLSESSTQADRIVVDELGNMYLMTASSIERRNAVGGAVFRCSELQWGDFHAIDVTDPLRPFAHFPATGKVVFFDNTLSVQGTPIDLFEQGFDNVEWMCGSRGDGYWLWDARNSELVRVDRNFMKRFSTGNLSILLNRALRPIGMMERGSYLYVLNEDYTLHVFDMFGSWKKSVPLAPVSSWMGDSGWLYMMRKDGKLEVIDTRSWLSEVLALPGSSGTYFYQNGRLFQVAEGRLRVYDRKTQETNK